MLRYRRRIVRPFGTLEMSPATVAKNREGVGRMISRARRVLTDGPASRYHRYTHVHSQAVSHLPYICAVLPARHVLSGQGAVSTLSNQNFGLVIAYVVPGFVALWGVSYFSPTVDSGSRLQQDAPTVAGFMYVTLASLAAGVTVSAVRWAVIDQLHHATGIVPPAWKFAHLEGKLQGYLTLIENHYRYYQFYSNMFVAVAFCFGLRESFCGANAASTSRGSKLGVSRPGAHPAGRFSGRASEVLQPNAAVTQYASLLAHDLQP